MNSLLWMFSITEKTRKKIEKLQKTSIYIILGKYAKNDYFYNLALLDIETLEERRQRRAIKFSVSILKHPQHRKMFVYTDSDKTRAGKKVVIPSCKTARYEKSTIPALAKIINEKLTHKI